jgi:uracil-DNA glycosylase
LRALERCRACPRLARYLDELRLVHPGYHCRPVASWGRASARLLLVGLAPGLHGANRSGRPFTGDSSGTFLFGALARAGFVTSPDPRQARLRDLRITNAVRCVPPGNRPMAAEVHQCSKFLSAELAELWRPRMRRPRAVVALGRIAHEAVGLALAARLPAFVHGQTVRLEAGLMLFDTYHPSRQNTNTGRLTEPMLDAVLERAKAHLSSS